ncbi:hypothetical protein [Methylobacterium nodulans]|uniref:Uncharacterized protein n=1 Tax=Methylobacterium nodulans (strain LMG 21967 / CNCM I-2342 / ORS 2060) TaxID=460265 RepID=B8IUI4_METNO|nr:hypothetical protein [Methylobacterium nodulans]ACL57052.1 conserved hypothetical protein [Methylobacterium nodulans ORS 2060]
MSVKSIAMMFGVLTLSAGPALAITVSNQDQREHTLTVDRGVEEKDTKIVPGASLKVDCPDGCSLRVRTVGYDRPAEPGDRLVIREDGLLHYASDDLATGSVQGSQAGDTGEKTGRASSK